MMKSKILVSINCTTYNHEKYIEDSLKSFLMQKTSFPFEILIHDDASTDTTPQIIKEYELKYPDLVKPLLQKENQYSIGIKTEFLNIQRAKGKYIAVCEGDDFWTDPYKLQKQVNFMEKHPDYSLCTHAAYKIKLDNLRVKSVIRPNRGNKIFNVDEVIMGGGGLFATNSMLYPAKFNEEFPHFYLKAFIGDYPLAIYLALKGKVYYIDEFMSAYRTSVPNSWTTRISSSIESKVKIYDKINKMLDDINAFTEYKYAKSIHEAQNFNTFNALIVQGKFNELKECDLKLVYNKLGSFEKAKIFVKRYLPFLASSFVKIKRKLKIILP